MKNNIDVVILCGGIGTRMQSFHNDIPKILLPLHGKTLLERQIEMVSMLPVNRIILATHYMSEMIEKSLKICSGFNLYLSKSSRLLDTGGALKHAVEQHGPMTPITLIVNGDILCDVDLRKMYGAYKNSYECLMLTTYSNKACEYGSVKTLNSRIVSFKEKNADINISYVNGGIYFFSSFALNGLPEKTVFSLEFDVFPYINSLYSYEHSGMWHDIGTPSRYRTAINNLNKCLKIPPLTVDSSRHRAVTA